MFTITLMHMPTGEERTFSWQDDANVWATVTRDPNPMDLGVVHVSWWKDEPQIIMGQEAICPHGLGRVMGVDPEGLIRIDTYTDNKNCKWAREDVELIDPRGTM